MDKLIITIISIAITAGTLYAGMDYLSGFYQRAQARGKAQKIIAQATQVDTAAHQAGVLSGNGGSWQTALVSTYLSAWPSGSYPCNMTDVNNGCDPSGSPSSSANGFYIMVDDLQACQEIQALANRGDRTVSSASAANPNGTSFTIAKNAGTKFMCFELVHPFFGGKTYYLIYRVFMDR